MQMLMARLSEYSTGKQHKYVCIQKYITSMEKTTLDLTFTEMKMNIYISVADIIAKVGSSTLHIHN